MSLLCRYFWPRIWSVLGATGGPAPWTAAPRQRWRVQVAFRTCQGRASYRAGGTGAPPCHPAGHQLGMGPPSPTKHASHTLRLSSSVDAPIRHPGRGDGDACSKPPETACCRMWQRQAAGSTREWAGHLSAPCGSTSAGGIQTRGSRQRPVPTRGTIVSSDALCVGANKDTWRMDPRGRNKRTGRGWRHP